MLHEEFIAATRGADWATIDELAAILEAANYWDEKHYKEDGEELKTRRRTHIRKMLRLTERKGMPLFIVIQEQDEHGREVQHYKQEESFTQADYERVIAYYRRRAKQKANRGS